MVTHVLRAGYAAVLTLIVGCASRQPVDTRAQALSRTSSLGEAAFTVQSDAAVGAGEVIAGSDVRIEGRVDLREPAKGPPPVIIKFVRPADANGVEVVEGSAGVTLVKEGNFGRLTCTLKAPPKKGIYRLEVADGLRHDKIAVERITVIQPEQAVQ